ncbi:MAG: hypothetical protein DBY39_01970 [Clostridiales bacterium]|nr:MAG: hypothetical protein DBY39_01970 [Clostridiales bacterium]
MKGGKIMDQLKKRIAANFSCFYYMGMLVYFEAVFHILLFKNVNILYPVLFALPMGLLLAWITDFFGPRVRKALYWAFTALFFLIYGSQLVYHHVFFSFYAISQLGLGGDMLANFLTETLIAIWESLPKLLLLMLPFAVMALAARRMQVWLSERRHSGILRQGSLLVTLVALYLAIVFLLLPLGGKTAYSPYDLYHQTWVLDLSIEKLGLIPTVKGDVEFVLFGDEEQISLEGKENIDALEDPEDILSEVSVPPEEQIDTSPNVLDIDFEALEATEENENIKALHTYFKNQPGTKKNGYTGMFEGYNLIMICAEAFSPAAIVDEQLTPALWKLTQEGFVFENYWSTFPSNTTNGEYAFLTGMLPDTSRAKSNSTFLASKDNCLPFCMGSVLRGEGVDCKGYHGHTATYYSRNETHPNIGYLDFKGRNEIGGLSGWPESDLLTVQYTIEEYIDEPRFHAYYMSVSGHHNYKFTGVNSMAEKNKQVVKSYTKLSGYSDAAQAYVACNMELEYALEYLLETLEEKDLLENTVIVLAADHYPYGLTDSEYAEFCGGNLAYDGLERYKSNLILWNGGMEEAVTISKPCCSIDVLPTLLNLFGIEYDSRLLCGQDILSDSAGVAIMSNQSFVTDKIVYNSSQDKVYQLTEEVLEEEYLQTYITNVKNRFTASAAVASYDYYAQVVPENYVGRSWKQ